MEPGTLRGASAHKSNCQDVWLAVGPLSTPPTWGGFTHTKGATVWDVSLMWNRSLGPF